MAEHEHEWQETQVGWSAVGRTWQQHGFWVYCPACGTWGIRKTMFLDGRFYATEEQARKHDRERQRAMAADRIAWRRAHYPDPAERLPPPPPELAP